ncbi:MAG: EAL domain-containing protein [Gammaproteobacteria bacterium]|nr:EAL domain-containing protein [Gammaproteobacteria bacterium]
MACRCQTLPNLSMEGGKLFLTFFDLFLLRKVSKQLQSLGYSCQSDGQLLRVDSDNIEQLIQTLCRDCGLSASDNMNIQLLITSADATSISPSELTKMRPLSTWCSQFNAQELIDVLQNKSLVVHFQPILTVSDQSIYAHEALIRGIAPDGKIIPPNVLFGQAKDAELLFNLDRMCRETIMHTAAKLNYFGRLFINFLPSAIYNPENCLSTTMALAERYGFDPHNLIFEVVETERIEDINHLRNILDYYRAKGFRTALDDMGSGYSSLNLLASLSPNIVKIDRELIMNIDQEPIKQAIVGGIMGMAKQTGITTLAEGVETQAEWEYIRSIGIDLVQGYYFGRPAAAPVTGKAD